MVGCSLYLLVTALQSFTEWNFKWHFLSDRVLLKVSAYTLPQLLLVMSDTNTLQSQHHHFFPLSKLSTLPLSRKHCTFTLDKLQKPVTFIPCGLVGVNQSHLWPSHSFPLWFATVFPTSTLHLDVSPLVKDSCPLRILDFTAGVDKVLKCWMRLFPQKQQAGEGM